MDFVNASSKLDDIVTSAENVQTILQDMFTDNDRVAVNILGAVVLTVCALTLYKVHRLETEVLKRLQEFNRHNKSLSTERDSLSPPSMNYSVQQERVVPKH